MDCPSPLLGKNGMDGHLKIGGHTMPPIGVWFGDGQGKEGGDLKDSEVVTHIDFSLSDPLARGCSFLKVSNLAVT